MAHKEHATKVALAGTFVGGLSALSGVLARRRAQVQFTPFELVQLGLATYRTGRLLAFERVAAPLREPFTETIPDASGAGEAVVATGDGAR